jgi:hypothetical protein
VLESRGEKRDFGLPEARVLAAHGGDRRSEAARRDQVRGRELERPKGKDTVDYIKAHLRRDDPDLAARVERGELSANAAAVAKGWRKKPTRLDKLRAAWRRTSPEDRRTFLSEVLARQEEAA